MDGTTAGQIGLAPLNSLPLSPVSPGVSDIPPIAPIQPPSPVSTVPDLSLSPPDIQPASVLPPVQSRYSQVTPVYAPTPVNTPADIQQPAVKGLEFVSNPTTTYAPTTQLSVAPPDSHLQEIENQLVGTESDPMVGIKPLVTDTVVATPPVVPAPQPTAVRPEPAPTPAPQESAAPASTEFSSSINSYFQNKAPQPVQSDVPIGPGSVLGSHNDKGPLLKKLGIVLGAVIILGIAGFFIVSAITANRGPQTPAAVTPKPATSSDTPGTTTVTSDKASAGTDTSQTPTTDKTTTTNTTTSTSEATATPPTTAQGPTTPTDSQAVPSTTPAPVKPQSPPATPDTGVEG